MRNSLSLVAAAGLCALAACTVKDTPTPPLMGPSTFGTGISLSADPDMLLQNGSQQSQLTVRVTDGNGSPKANERLRAEIMVAGVTQDYGTLSSKDFFTNSSGEARVVYTPPPLPSSGVVTGQTVTLVVTPFGSDFGSNLSRRVNIRVIPPGVIGPTNPALVAAFTISPNPPTAFAAASFDASTSTNQGAACASACTYNWNFGDGTTSVGITTLHEYRSSGSKTITLTVTDAIGAQATNAQTVTVAAATPPTAVFQVSPSAVGVNQDVFFNASESKPATGRTITHYDWNFGDGETSGGLTVSHRYGAPGTFQVILVVTDDVGTTGQAVKAMTVSTGNPVASLVFLPASPKVGTVVAFNAGGSTSTTATIVSYKFHYGDGSTDDVGAVPNQTHIYTAQGTFVTTVTVTDSIGRTASASVSVTVVP